MKRVSRPPLLIRWLLRRLLPDDAVEFVAGDLDEEYRRYATANAGARTGRLRAGWWYRWQAARTLALFLRSTGSGNELTDPLRSPGGLIMHASMLWQDVRYTLRNLRQAPGFTLTVLLTLGLGIGAATAMFSAVHEVLLRPLSFAEPDRLVMLWDDNAQRDWRQVEVAPANAFDWRERVSAFEDVALASPWTNNVALQTDGQAVAVSIGQATGNLFPVLGIPAVLGRTFTFEDTWRDSGPLVLLSHEVWATSFGADPDIVGRTIALDGESFEVIGVMPEGFRYAINDAQMWVTFRWDPAIRDTVWFRQAHVAHGVARLRPGVSLQEARAELTTVGAQLREEYPQLNLGMEPGFTELHRFLVGDRRAPMLLLLGAVGLLQLIACANVANLLLVRANSRRHELAVRSALGAGRGRLATLALSEAALLSVGGTLVGVVVAAAAMRWLEAIRPPELPELALSADPSVLAFTAAVAAGSALLFGLAPVLSNAGAKLSGRLADGARSGTAGRSSQRAGGTIVALEVALAVILVLGAGLLVRSLAQLSRVDTGFDPDAILTFELRPPAGSYPRGADREALAYRIADELRGLPAVASVGVTRNLPLTGYAWSSDFNIEGWGPNEFGIDVRHRAVNAEYFRTMGVPAVEGEIFDDARAPDQPVPVVVNETFVRTFFPDSSPVGRRIAFDRHPDEDSYWYPIVAVVGDERMLHADQPHPEIISHFAGDTPQTIRFAIAAQVPPSSLIEPARRAVARVDARLPFVQPRTMREVAADALVRERFLMTLLTTFALCALALATIGVYGVAAQGARTRTREIGIRMALGATGEQIVRALLVRAGVFVAAGLLLGLAAAAASGRVIAGLLFEVGPLDGLTWAVVCALLAAVGLAASWLPARRAARTDPARVLYTE
jgi:putative ABC transport system permease protein